MTDVIHEIPWQVANNGGLFSSGQYSPQDNTYDYALGGIPFLSATRDQWPYTEGMAEIRKQQFDSFAEPGEQSLQGWWLRSQSNFGGGAGLVYQDPDNDNQFNIRYSDSLGIDPWSPGDLKLLRDSTLKVSNAAAAPQQVRGFVDGTGVDAFWHMDSTTLNKVTDAATTLIADGAGTNNWLASSGLTYYLAKSNGLWTGNDAGAAVQSYNVPIDIIEFAKARLIGGAANSMYVLNTAGPGLPAPFYTHPNPNWRWKSISEGPSAVYAAGDDGTTSAIFKFTLDTAGAVPTFTGGVITAQMPAGERINTIYGYVGTFVGIATNKGFRVGTITSGFTSGDIAYGPLLFQPTGGCNGIVGYDRFMYTGSTNQHDGASGLYRVDLGSVIQEKTTNAVRYAYARDIYLSTSPFAVTSLTIMGSSDRKVFAIPGTGAALEAATDLLPSGYIKTGRIRFNTEEPKLYKFFSVRTPTPLKGDVQVALLDQGGGETLYITYTSTFAPGTGDIATPTPSGPQNWVAYKFTLKRGTNPAFGGILNGWQVKALPGSIRQRIIIHTFLLFDEETDKTGQRIGYDGYANDRLDAFRQLARRGDIVLFQELADQVVTQVVIDDWKFTQLGPPGPNGESRGGYLTVTMRTVAESA